MINRVNNIITAILVVVLLILAADWYARGGWQGIGVWGDMDRRDYE